MVRFFGLCWWRGRGISTGYRYRASDVTWSSQLPQGRCQGSIDAARYARSLPFRYKGEWLGFKAVFLVIVPRSLSNWAGNPRAEFWSSWGVLILCYYFPEADGNLGYSFQQSLRLYVNIHLKMGRLSLTLSSRWSFAAWSYDSSLTMVWICGSCWID